MFLIASKIAHRLPHLGNYDPEQAVASIFNSMVNEERLEPIIV